jgi:hypothetical protein
MTRRGAPLRAGALAAVVAASLTLAAGATAADPVEVALARSDAYASPAALGPAAAGSGRRLAAAAAALARGGRPAKIAVVAGPAGSPSLAVYAGRLRARLRFAGTVVLTTVAGPTAAAGPLPPARAAGALRAGGVEAVADPTERAISAARLVAEPVPARAAAPAGRSLAALLLMAGVGGAWAAAVGVRRERRRVASDLADARARALVRLDALTARVADLGSRGAADPESAELIRRAGEAGERAREAIGAAARAEDVEDALPALREGLAAAAAAAGRAGEHALAEDFFAGLCAVDPAHGPASALAAASDAPEALSVCAACAEAAARGEPPARRLAPSVRDGRPVPFAEAELI